MFVMPQVDMGIYQVEKLILAKNLEQVDSQA